MSKLLLIPAVVALFAGCVARSQSGGGGCRADIGCPGQEICIGNGSCGNDDFCSVASRLSTTEFAGGDGTEASPWLICNAEQLDLMRADVTAHYALRSDVSLLGTGFTVIGGEFAGHFNGRKHRIIGFSDTTGGADRGFFSNSIGLIENVHFVDAEMTGTSAGVIVGEQSAGGRLVRCSATGSVTGSGGHVGGLVGTNYGHVIESWAAVTVANPGGGNATGGLVGHHYPPGVVLRSFATGDVSNASTATGGLVGSADGTVINSYATGSVSGAADSTGGLAGRLNGSVVSSYAAGAVTSTSGTPGGLAGTGSGTASCALWSTDGSGLNTSPKGTGVTSSELAVVSTFRGWNFDTPIWVLDTNVWPYPYLAWQDAMGVTRLD